MVDRPKSAMQARRSSLTRMFAFVDGWGVSMEVFHLEEMKHTPFKSPWTMRRPCMCFNPFATPASSMVALIRLFRGRVTTHKLSTVCVPVSLNKLVDVSVVHPLGNKSKSVFV